MKKAMFIGLQAPRGHGQGPQPPTPASHLCSPLVPVPVGLGRRRAVMCEFSLAVSTWWGRYYVPPWGHRADSPPSFSPLWVGLEGAGEHWGIAGLGVYI